MEFTDIYIYITWLLISSWSCSKHVLKVIFIGLRRSLHMIATDGSGHVYSLWCLKARTGHWRQGTNTYRDFYRTPSTIIQLIFCLTTGPKPPPKRFLHIVRSRASSFKWQYPLLSLRSSSSFLRLLHRLLVTSISPFIFLSITCFRRQFLRKMWPIQLAFHPYFFNILKYITITLLLFIYLFIYLVFKT